jgi:hypothetical protein
MSAAEIIEQIKALSPEGQAKVAEFVRDLAATEPRVMEDAKFYKAADAAFSKHGELLKKLAK